MGQFWEWLGGVEMHIGQIDHPEHDAHIAFVREGLLRHVSEELPQVSKFANTRSMHSSKGVDRIEKQRVVIINLFSSQTSTKQFSV